MSVKRLGKPHFLSVNEVEDKDVFEVVEAPVLVPADQSKWNKERYRIVICKPNDREFGLRMWTLNSSTSDRLLDAFGGNASLWKGRKIRVHKHAEHILGKEQFVLYGEPYVDPQKPLMETV